MLLRSPQNLHYPITVTELLRKQDDAVGKNQPILSYNYKSKVTESNKYGEQNVVEKTFPARLEAEVEGKITAWKVAKGIVIERAGVEIADIQEPCTHDVQFGGMCANCGKDMTLLDYGTRIPDYARANINMTHGNTALRVSQDEAYRLETSAKKRLLEVKKLSLVVDLDQTIIHATVDPTVGEWMDDPTNPNHEAVKDVRKFQLMDDGPCQGNWYYVKLRPGLAKFLQVISQLYELHIYTMGTRAYALSIAKIVDPDKKIFGERILSRDESGSMTVKSLQRLFPVDTKMVVIIDDRGDVWNWNQNLIKVYPYDFFKGIGDINSSFLPKRQDAISLPNGLPTSSATEIAAEGEVEIRDTAEPSNAEVSTLSPTINGPSSNGDAEKSTVESLVSMSGNNDAAAMKEKTTEQGERLKAQIADRPLLQEQMKLDKADEEAAVQLAASLESTDENGNSTQVTESEAPIYRHNLLQDDDDELYHLENALRNVHAAFFEVYLGRASSQTLGVGRIGELRGEKSPKKRPDLDISLVPNVEDIMSKMKQAALGGTTITFSGVIPLGIHPASSETGRWASSFGAGISYEVTKATTHVIGNRNHDTAKMRLAARYPQIKIVTLNWLNQVFKEWKMVEETPYVISVVPDKSSRRKGRAAANGDDDLLGDSEEYGIENRPEVSETGTEDEDDEDMSEQERRSPGDDIEDDEWDEMGKEFDDDDSDSDLSDISGSDGALDIDVPNGDSLATAESASKKRKRLGPSDSVDGNETDTSTASTGSKLQRRKKQALERTSSLNQVTTLGETKGNGSSQKITSTTSAITPAISTTTDQYDQAEQDAAFEELALLLASDDDDDQE